MATTTRYIGYCPCCDGEFKVRDNKLVHHGYQRPGFGYIVGDCFGALRTPHELSTETAVDYLDLLGTLREAREAGLKSLDTVETLVVIRLSGSKTYHKTETQPYEWENLVKQQKWLIESELRQINFDIVRLNKLISAWEPKSLRTVEEEQESKRAAKAKREVVQQQKRQDKVQKAVESFQKRIDSALKTKNSSVIAEVWERAQEQLPGPKEAAIALLDRDHVWAAFGLTGMIKARWDDRSPQPYQPILARMKSRMYRIRGEHRNYFRRDDWERRRLQEMSFAWPEELGGENSRGQKTLAEVESLLK